MNEEIQEIERLIKQIGDLGESSVRLARKLQEQDLRRSQNYPDDTADQVALERKRTGEPTYSDAIRGKIAPQRDYGEARRAVLDGTMTPQEAAVNLLCAAAADKTMTQDHAASEIAKLLWPDLPVSRRIAIREDLKATFRAGGDVASWIQPFLKNNIEQAEQQKTIHERRLAPAA